MNSVDKNNNNKKKSSKNESACLRYVEMLLPKLSDFTTYKYIGERTKKMTIIGEKVIDW